MDTARLSTGKSKSQHRETAPCCGRSPSCRHRLETELGMLRAPCPAASPSASAASAAAAARCCSHISRSPQTQLHPRVKLGLLAPSAWAQFGSRRAQKVTQVTNNSRPHPCANPFLGDSTPPLCGALGGSGREGFPRGRSCSLPVCSPLFFGSLGLPSTWLPSLASSLPLADEPGAGGTWSSRATSRASLAPVAQGEGRDATPTPPTSWGWLSDTPRDGWVRMERVRLWSRDRPSLLRDEITAMSAGMMKGRL